MRRGRREILAGLDLAIQSHECLALIGPNGSGKTTLLRALLGLLRADGGQVLVDQVPIDNLSARQRGAYAAYVPQAVEHIPPLTVYDVVAGGRYCHAPALRPLGQRDRAAIESAIARCGLSNLADRILGTLSGGERQKVMLAAAIAQDARMLFLDEPSTALDPAYQIELARLIREWHEEGRGVVLVSHELQLPAAVASRVVALRGGSVVADGTPEEVLEPARLTAVFGTQFEVVQRAGGATTVLPAWGGRARAP